MRERIKDFDVTDRAGATQKLTEARWGRFSRALTEFEGWASRLRSDFGPPPPTSSSRTGSIETEAGAGGRRAGARLDRRRTATRSRVVDLGERLVQGEVIERETSAATHVTVPAALLASPVYEYLRKSYAKLDRPAGPPPYTITFGKKSAQRRDVRGLQHEALELAKEGIQCRASRVSAR